MDPTLDLQSEVHAYESTNCCRLASFILALVPPTTVDRNVVVDNWTERYPWHAVLPRHKNVRYRVNRGLARLQSAGIAQPAAEQTIEVLNIERLRLAAGNLAIVEDDQGVAVPRGLWSARPRVPAHLQTVQANLERQWQQEMATAEQTRMRSPQS